MTPEEFAKLDPTKPGYAEAEEELAREVILLARDRASLLDAIKPLAPSLHAEWIRRIEERKGGKAGAI